MMSVLILFSFKIFFILSLKKVGGWDNFILNNSDRLHVVMPLDHPELPWLAVFFGGMWIPHFFYWGFSQFIVQRSLAAKDIEAGQKGVLLGATLKAVSYTHLTLPTKA